LVQYVGVGGELYRTQYKQFELHLKWHKKPSDEP
jgi:hypothetical protein